MSVQLQSLLCPPRPRMARRQSDRALPPAGSRPRRATGVRTRLTLGPVWQGRAGAFPLEGPPVAMANAEYVMVGELVHLHETDHALAFRRSR